ncbi:hypothetical protein DERP_003678 [Dermatophagoides pteronyssinus]|uniref:TOG domain-containing protein n=1 Tax=Dermatophagoides pteronyssinus TaxID=6956 RepID=A0ABQ8JLA7_DERPT|nr:hypothetical protein DERP_003678 [Dermatophagoides pteronyssinus]
MDWFELNSHLRLLRQQQQQHSIPQRTSFSNNPSSQLPSSSSTTTTSTSKIPTNIGIGNSQFVITGRRLETLKSLRKLLKKFPNRLNRSTIITIFDCLKSIIVDLTAIYFNLDSAHQPNHRNNHPNGSFIPHPMVRCNSMAQIPSSTTMTTTTTASKTQSPSMLRKTLSTDNVFIQSIRRNELLESIQIIIDLISMKSIPSVNQSDNQSISNNQQMAADHQDVDGCQEDYFGRMFLPEIITLLGHESSDVQRISIRFLQSNILRTENLQRTMQTFIDYGLQSKIIATKFGSLNALPHLFIRQEFRSENLGPLISCLGRMLVRTQTEQPHIFYPTYISLERLNSLIGSKRFYQYLFNCGSNDNGETDISKKAVTIYETVQKRAPSPHVYISNFGMHTFVDPSTTTNGTTNGASNQQRRGSKQQQRKYSNDSNKTIVGDGKRGEKEKKTKSGQGQIQSSNHHNRSKSISSIKNANFDKQQQKHHHNRRQKKNNWVEKVVEKNDWNNDGYVEEEDKMDYHHNHHGNGSSKQNNNQNSLTNNDNNNRMMDVQENINYNEKNDMNRRQSTTTTATAKIIENSNERDDPDDDDDGEGPVRISDMLRVTNDNNNNNNISKPGKPSNELNDQNNVLDYIISKQQPKQQSEQREQRVVTKSSSSVVNPETTKEEVEQNYSLEVEQQQQQQRNSLFINHNNEEEEVADYNDYDESLVYSTNIDHENRRGQPDLNKNYHKNDDYDDDDLTMKKSSGYHSDDHRGRRESGSGGQIGQQNPHHQQHSNLNRSTNQSSKNHYLNVKQSSSSSLNPVATRQVTFAANGKHRKQQQQQNSNVVGSKVADKKPQSLSVLKQQQQQDSSPISSRTSDDDDEIRSNNPNYHSKKPTQINNNNNNQTLSKDRNMAAAASTSSTTNFLPQQHGSSSLASLTQLDADTLANIEYIPTMKDYLLPPYYHPYYHHHDPLYHPATYAAAAAVATSPILYPTPPTNPHLLRFGIFPRILIYQALSSIADEQFAAVQALVRIVRDSSNEHLQLLLPHMDEFLSIFITQLLLDSSSNFKIILWTLDIIELLTERFRQRLQPNLSQIILLLSQRLGDNRIVIRDSVIKVFHQMMTKYCPQEMLDLLFKHVSSNAQHHQQPLAFTSSSKLREEMANRITASITTFPRSRLNLPKLCFDIVPFLIDRRSLVRLASLECLATLAQALGPHKLGSLMTAVHSLESSLTAIDFDRLIASIQARLARRSLPRVGPDGNVQYVLRVPTSNDSWYYRRIYDADLEWIAIGPTTPPVNVPLLLNTPTVGLVPKFPIENQSTESSSEPSRTNDSSPANNNCCQQERQAIQKQGLLNSPDSEDIPPPVKSKIIVDGGGGGGGHHHHHPCYNRSSTSPELSDAHNKTVKIRSRSRSKPQTKQQHSSSRKTTKIDPDGLAQDPPSPLRNFSDHQQQKELEQRYHSLEQQQQQQSYPFNRSKTSQEFRPYGNQNNQNKQRTRRDQFIERLVRGESVDDSDLADAEWFRRSSTESLEAWRQYFGRFKKQMADISLLNGPIGVRPYGGGSSRPGSSVYYGLSPLPPPPFTLPAAAAATFAPPGFLSPSYYYHYYIANGLSNSYHDLSQLQQKNMMSIMKRSGFVSGSDQDPDPDIDRSDENLHQKSDEKLIRKSNAAGGYSGQHSDEEEIGGKSSSSSTRKRSTNIDRQTEGKNLHKQQQRQQQQESLSNQQLEPEPLPMERSFSMPSIRTDSASAENDSHLMAAVTNQQDNTQIISEEVIQELGMWEQVIQEEKNQQSSSSTTGNIESKSNVEDLDTNVNQRRSSTMMLPQEQSAQNVDNNEQIKIESKSTAKTIPTVNIQPSTPSVQSSNLMKGSSKESAPIIVQSPPPPPKQSSLTDNTETDQQQQQQSSVVAVEELKRQESIKMDGDGSVDKQSVSTVSKQEQIDPKQSPPATTSNVKSKLPPPATSTVTKTGPAAPPASRRMSKPPQQLYIKTTPAIPMNANIQHILGNVARTEGPFDNPYDAVKSAVIALRDHAWTTKVEGMLAVVRLATFHPHHLIRDQHQISIALASETRNLRSTVARSAIFTIGELFSKLRSQIESELDILTQALLHKVSENSVFIREDIDRALQLMIESMPQTRAALALITFGSSHRNTHVRRTSAQFISALVEKMGPMKCLLGPRDIGEHLLPAAARFIQDQSSHTRYFGRRIFATLMQHPLFDKFLRRHVSPGTYRNICGMLETIKRRGVGDAPSDLYSPTVQPKDSDPRRLIIIEATTPS